jgi:hypothetical protein
MSEPKPLVHCQRNLLVLWVVGAIPPFAVMFIQSLNDYYGEANQEAWGWLLSALMPTLSLMVGSYVVSQRRSQGDGKTIDPLIFWLAAFFSILFLCVVSGTVFYLPFSRTPPIATMHRTNLLLGSLQGVVGTSLGVFFVSGHSVDRARPSRISTAAPNS